MVAAAAGADGAGAAAEGAEMAVCSGCARPVLRETRPGIFSLKSRVFLHFHDDPCGIFAGVRLADDFVRMRVTTRPEQADLLERIDARLSSVEAHAKDERGRREQRRG